MSVDARTTFILAMTGKSHSQLLVTENENKKTNLRGGRSSIRIHYPKNTYIDHSKTKEGDIVSSNSSTESALGTIFPPPPVDKDGAPYLDRMSASHAPLDARDTQGLSINHDENNFIVQRKEGTKPYIDQWRQSHAPPRSLPNLDHTGVRTPFTYQGPTFLRPDGSIGNELRNDIRDQFRQIPNLPYEDINDMNKIDYQRSVTKAMMLEMDEEEEEEDDDDGNGNGENKDIKQIETSLSNQDPSNIHHQQRPSHTMAKHGSASLFKVDTSNYHAPSPSSSPTSTTHSIDMMKKKFKKKTKKKTSMKNNAPLQNRRKKPFSSDSLFDCLLDIKFGKTDAKSMNNLSETERNKNQSQSSDWDVTSFKDHFSVHFTLPHNYHDHHQHADKEKY
mmetsp:Transcript_29103/g.34313  ORF Transcript_29103/g.34313 Transcript_29103/m.34313 type:complete len:390 (+) Transcript_29103:161-1330(+)